MIDVIPCGKYLIAQVDVPRPLGVIFKGNGKGFPVAFPSDNVDVDVI
jgi:hypothetical protein